MLTVDYKTDGDTSYADRIAKFHNAYDSSDMNDANPKELVEIRSQKSAQGKGL